MVLSNRYMPESTSQVCDLVVLSNLDVPESTSHVCDLVVSSNLTYQSASLILHFYFLQIMANQRCYFLCYFILALIKL